MNPYIMEMIAKERQREIEEEAQRLHLLAMHRAGRPSAKERILLGLGELLITAGAKLTDRYGRHLRLSAGSKECRQP